LIFAGSARGIEGLRDLGIGGFRDWGIGGLKDKINRD
jgi:hypothetical protein